MFCPYCGKEISDTAKVCGYCGKKQKVSTPPPLEQVVVEPPQPAEEKSVPAPSPLIEEEAVEELPSPPPAPPVVEEPVQPLEPQLVEAPAKEKRGLPKWVWGVGGVVVITLLIVIAFPIVSGNTQPNDNSDEFDERVASDPTKTQDPPSAMREKTEKANVSVEGNFPQIVDSYLNNARLADFEGFDDPHKDWFNWRGSEDFNNGIVEINGTGEWGEAGFFIDHLYNAGDAALFLFKFDGDAELAIYMGTEDISSPNYKRYEFWRAPSNPDWDGYRGALVRGENGSDYPVEEYFVNQIELTPGKWYYILFASDTSGCLIVVWEKGSTEASQAAHFFVDFTPTSEWQNQDWYPRFYTNTGQVTLDEYSRIDFSSIK